jgi:nucleotide-binding universal stress UspA family protein
MFFLNFWELSERGKEIVGRYVAKAHEQQVTHVASFVLTLGDPKDAVLALATEHNVNIIFIGPRGLGVLDRLLIGSFSNYILSHAECPVLLVK